MVQKSCRAPKYKNDIRPVGSLKKVELFFKIALFAKPRNMRKKVANYYFVFLTRLFYKFIENQGDFYRDYLLFIFWNDDVSCQPLIIRYLVIINHALLTQSISQNIQNQLNLVKKVPKFRLLLLPGD